MKYTAQDIKTLLSQELTKRGHTIDEFEVQLKKIAANSKDKDLSKEAGLDIVPILKSLASVVGGGAAAVGALGGAGLYAGYKANENSNEKLMQKMREQQAYEQATESLRRAMADAQTPAI